MNFENAKNKLKEYAQEHILDYYDELNDSQKEALLKQIDETDFSVTSKVINGKAEDKRGVITPIKAMTLTEINASKEHFKSLGLEAIRAGKVSAVLLAGGMGTRLGSDNPKGMYDIGITKPVYIFQRIIRNLLDVVDEAGVWIHLFIMTSDKNHEATTSFFKEQNYFTYNPDYIHFSSRIWPLPQLMKARYIWKQRIRLPLPLMEMAVGSHLCKMRELSI